MLLGVDAAALRGRRHEPGSERRAHGVRGLREAWPLRPLGRARQRRRAGGDGMLVAGTLTTLFYTRRSPEGDSHGHAVLEDLGAVPRNLQLRLRLPVHSRADDGAT